RYVWSIYVQYSSTRLHGAALHCNKYPWHHQRRCYIVTKIFVGVVRLRWLPARSMHFAADNSCAVWPDGAAPTVNHATSATSLRRRAPAKLAISWGFSTGSTKLPLPPMTSAA